jgi:hypothetical protein
MALKVKTNKVIDGDDWDKLVMETYGRPYCLQQQDGCMERGQVYIQVPVKAYDHPNETVPEKTNHPKMGVSFAAWLARDPKQPLKSEDDGSGDSEWVIKLWWERNFYPTVEMISNDLHKKGLLEAGEYYIDIDW